VNTYLSGLLVAPFRTQLMGKLLRTPCDQLLDPSEWVTVFLILVGIVQGFASLVLFFAVYS
jgi:hypothetical protein